jgi:tetratricopeptide (TPR) repeat protein
VAAQGTASFDARCLSCHETPDATCSRGPDLEVKDVTGEEARTPEGCVDCHVRRSQPFDLPALRTADHWIRRRPPPPKTMPMRFFADPDGALTVYDDGRLTERIAQPGGRRWADGLAALGLSKQQRMQAAAALLSDFPAPGSPAAVIGSAPNGLPDLEEQAAFHHVRGLILESTGETSSALLAFGDALKIDAAHPEARLNRARLRLESGDLEGALSDATILVESYPAADKPWNIRARAAAMAGDIGAAAQALALSTERWPSDPASWHELGRLLLELDRPAEARTALEQARRLQPDRPGLADDLATAEQREAR